MPLTPGARLGSYEVVGHLGAGGMGEVFHARDLKLGREVALKLLPEGLASSPDRLSRLEREARTLASLHHPHVATLFAFEKHDSQPFLVMEFVPGETLAERIARGPLPLHEALALFRQIAEGLEAAHEKGVVHRDLKPANVKITPDGQAKVLDFGLAKSVESTSGPISSELPTESHTGTTPGVVVGTAAYMSPEQARGLPVDRRTDVWAFGACLYEALSGRRAFAGATMTDVLAQVLEREPDWEALPKDLPPAVRLLVQRCLRKDRTERLRDVADARLQLEDSLDAAREGATAAREPASLTDRGPVHPVLRLPRWRRLALPGAIALAVLLFGAFILWRADRARQHMGRQARLPVIAVASLVNVGQDPSLEPLAAGSAVVLISSLGAVPGIQVLSRDATLDYRGVQRNLLKLLEDLAATYVVDATLQRAGDRVRATVNLVDHAGTVAWSGTYDGALDDPFALQERIADGLARGLVGLGVVRPEALASAAPRLHSPPTQDRDAYADYLQARAFLERSDVGGSLEAAVRLFERAIERDPSFALAFAGLGEAYWAQYDETSDVKWPPLAIAAVSKALSLDPGLPQVRVSYARILAGSGRLDEAATQVRVAIANAPESDDAYRELGDVLERAGKVEEALAAYREAIDRRPTYWRNYSYLGALLYRVGRNEEALNAYRRVVQLRPDAARGHNSLGTIYAGMGRTKEALAEFERALGLNPTASTYSNAGTVQFWEGRLEEARLAFEEAVRLGPSTALYRRNLGDALAKLGRAAGAREAWSRCVTLAIGELKVNPRNVEALSMAAVCDAKLGRAAEARMRVDGAIAIAPDDPDVLHSAAVVSALAGRREESIERLLRALDQGSSRVVAQHDDELAAIRQDPRVAARLAGKER